MLGFQSPAEIAGMLAGIGGWAAMYAAACSDFCRHQWWREQRFSEALRLATWLKAGVSLIGWIALLAEPLLNHHALVAVGFLGMGDSLAGMVALWVVGQFAGMSDITDLSRLDSFGWTTMVTLIDGFLVTLMILALAAVVWSGRRVRQKWIGSPALNEV